MRSQVSAASCGVELPACTCTDSKCLPSKSCRKNIGDRGGSRNLKRGVLTAVHGRHTAVGGGCGRGVPSRAKRGGPGNMTYLHGPESTSHHFSTCMACYCNV